MKNKRVLVLGLVLVLFTLIAGVVLAQESGNSGGVSWRWEGNNTVMVNSNSYGVTVFAVYSNGGSAGAFWFEAGQSRTLSGYLKIGNINRIKPANPQ